jgi:hypothetical protein
MSETEAKSGDLAITLGTYIFLLDAAGYGPDHAGLRTACDALKSASEGDDPESLGQALVAVVSEHVSSDASPEDVAGWLKGLYGEDHVSTDLGADRGERLRSARSYMFQHSLPWLARIIDRFPDGSVGPHWVMVEQLTDRVVCMDPYPWDDLDEEYDAPVVEFAVKWELAGCGSVRFVR